MLTICGCGDSQAQPQSSEPPARVDTLLLAKQLIDAQHAAQQHNDQEPRMQAFRDPLREAIVDLEKQRRALAQEERRDIDAKLEKLEQLQEIRAKSLSYFEVGDRGLIPRPQHVSSLIARWKRHRDQFKYLYLTDPENTQSQVASGRALNLFLDLCGQTALKHTHYREAGKDTAAQALPDSLGKDVNLTTDQIAHIKWAKGLKGPKKVGSLNDDDPLPLDWPSALRDEPKYATYREAIEAGKRKAIEELENGKQPSVETMKKLDADLKALFLAFVEEAVSESRRTRQIDTYSVADTRAVKQFLELARNGVFHLKHAKQIEDVNTPHFKGQTAEELLAYMTRLGLRFGPAEPEGQSTYWLLYELLTAYYTDLHAVHLAMQQTERDINGIEQKAAELMRIQYERTMDAVRTDLGSEMQHADWQVRLAPWTAGAGTQYSAPPMKANK
jgi:transcriptional regulator with XRE-family HTH domain